ncbi:hypothetical protein TSAR_008257 [Trichomalopsis sarcophagae]|uniref:Uncharacterized protein n=1 Tax=Trichomalopsis sarcophagae TaxID=543379 RepID=A0A232ETA0_9HYME|nr:hypothetical protein TSAR_008257 [Trichomalopsis sarcophagae]
MAIEYIHTYCQQLQSVNLVETLMFAVSRGTMTGIALKLILICTLSLKISSTLDLKDTISNTDSFFNNMMKKYGKFCGNKMTELNKVQISIDKEIDQYLKLTTQQLFQVTRYKKQLEISNVQETDVRVFNGLEEVLSLNVSDVRDMHFFKKYIGYEQWFGVALTSSSIVAYKVFQDKLEKLESFPIRDTFKLHIVNFHGTTLLFAQKSQSVTVRYFLLHDGKFSIKEIYQLGVKGLKDLSIWRKEDELFLAASTLAHIFIYTWQTDHFDLEQILTHNSKFSKAFHLTSDSDLLVASSDSPQKATKIFSYDSRIRQFVAVQTIHQSFDDVALLHLRHSKTSESFLALSGNESTIVYKRSADDALEGFLPFQEIGSADRVIAIGNNNTLLLVLLKDDVVDVYQYDGWRFIRLDSQIVGVENVKVVTVEGEEGILVKRTDGSWSLNRINWMKVNQPVNFNDEIHKWCLAAKEKAKHIPKLPVSEAKAPIRMTKGQLQRVKVQRVNDMSIEKLRNLTERYDQLLLRLSVINESLSQTMSPEIRRFDTLRAQTIRANCTNRCSAHRLVTELSCDIFSNLPRVDDKTQNLTLEHVKVDTLDGFPCPVAAIELKEVNVKGLLNGADFNEMQKNALRTSGDQVISAEHVFANLHVDSILAPNLEPASTHTRQNIRTTSIHAKELNLTDGGLLLPLDGEPVIMPGTLTASKVKFNRLIDQHGGIRGRSIKRVSPMADFLEFHELNGDYHLNNVQITGLLSASDVARTKGGTEKTLGEIVKRVVRLDEDVPVRLALRSNTTLWKNITVQNLPNWLTRKNSEMVRVTGEKIAFQKVTLPDSLYENLPVPRIQTPMCSVGAVTSDIKTSTIRVGQATAKVVESQNVIGARDLDNAMRDAVTSLNEVDLSRKNFTGTVTVKNLNISHFESSPFYSYQKSKFSWYQPNVIKGPVSANNLKVSSLTTKSGIRIPSPTEIRNMIVEGDLQVETINGIRLDELLQNIVKLTDKVSLKKVTFEGTLEVDQVEAKNVNFDLQSFENGASLGNKIISGDLEIEGDLWIPNLLSYPTLDEIESYKSLQTPQFGSWESFESRMFSKTKLQEIKVPVYLRTATIPNIITTENSTLRSSDQYLNDLLYNTLKKSGNQTIKEKWHFGKLIVEDNLTLLGKINNLNLSSDVARHDVETNRVTGKKIIHELTVRNLKGMNFSEWAEDAFIPSNGEKLTIIKGRKTFDYLNARLVHVNGTVMGKKLEECLLKTGDQVITAAKVINGSLHAPSLIVNGLINDINLTDFTNNLLQKQKPVQRIKSKVVFSGNVQVMGDLDVKEMFQQVESSKTNLINETLVPAIEKLAYLKPFAIGVEQTMKRRAKYWDKFEYVNENVTSTNQISSLAPNVNTSFYKLGNCILISLAEVSCNEQNKYYLKVISNSSGVLVNQLLSVDGVPLVVQVSSGPRSRITIYMYDYITNSFDIATSIRAPGITQASLSADNRVVWIATRLKSQMLLARFETWNDLQKYHLPDSRIFALDVVPTTNEFVLVREDGMWKLEGLAGPRHAFKASLKADRFETFARGRDFFIRLVCKNAGSKLLKARYVGV